MSKKFAEQIIDGMVDESGHCGERGMSVKQFECIIPYLKEESSENVGAWCGNYGGRIEFYENIWVGEIGKYHVILSEFCHFHRRCTVVEINLRPAEEIAAEQKAERKEHERREAEKAMREKSQWVGTPKKRETFELTLKKDYAYERDAYTYGTEIAHIYTLADADGNLFVWKTTNAIELWDDDADEFIEAKIGSKVTMKATVKEHSEYRGTKQTVITRPKITAIA